MTIIIIIYSHNNTIETQTSFFIIIIIRKMGSNRDGLYPTTVEPNGHTSIKVITHIKQHFLQSGKTVMMIIIIIIIARMRAPTQLFVSQSQ